MTPNHKQNRELTPALWQGLCFALTMLKDAITRGNMMLNLAQMAIIYGFPFILWNRFGIRWRTA